MHNFLVVEQEPTLSPQGVFFLDSNIAQTLGKSFSDYGGGIFPYRYITINGKPFTALSHIVACTYNGKKPNPIALALTGRDFYADVLFAAEDGNYKALLNQLGFAEQDIPVV